MPTNYLTQFATSSGANLPAESDWQAITERSTGFQTGLARSAWFNRLFAQGAVAGYALGQFVVEYGNADADLNGDNLYSNFKTALNARVSASYLAKAGGTMTGTITRNGVLAQSGTESGAISIQNGTNSAAGGGGIWLYGASHSTSPGKVRLQAYDSTNQTYYALDVNGDGTLTWAGNSFTVGGTAVSLNGHTHSYLPLSGGTVTGNINVKYNITSWASAPSATQYESAIKLLDGSNSAGFQIEAANYSNGDALLKLQVNPGSFGGSQGAQTLGIGYHRTTGLVYTAAPTPPTADNSAQIATTAWVTTKVGNYLPLAGGTMTGDITRNGVLAKSGAAAGMVAILGGASSAATAGGKLYLYGVDNSTYPGGAMIQTGNADGYRQFILKPDGAINWDGRARFFGLGTYSSVHLKGVGNVTSSGTALDLFLPIPFGNGVTTITMTGITGWLRHGGGGYLTPGNASNSNLLSGSTVSWYNLDSNCPTMRLVRSGGWGSGVPNNCVVCFDITVAFKCT